MTVTHAEVAGVGDVDPRHEDQRLDDLDEALPGERVLGGGAPVLGEQELLGANQGGHIDQDVGCAQGHGRNTSRNQATVSGRPTTVEGKVGTGWLRNPDPSGSGPPPLQGAGADRLRCV